MPIAYDSVIPWPDGPAPIVSSRFKITFEMETGSQLPSGFTNIVRVAPPRLRNSECRPCVSVSASGFLASIVDSQEAWSKFSQASFAVQTSQKYRVKVSLLSRKLKIKVFKIESGGVETMAGDNTAGMSFAGAFSQAEPVVAWGGLASSGVATGNLKPSSFFLTEWEESHLLANFTFVGDILHNSIRFTQGFLAPPLVQASSVSAYSSVATSNAILRPGEIGYGYFDLHSMLLLTLENSNIQPSGELNTGFSVCLKHKRTLPFNTLFTTLINAYGVSLRYYAYFNTLQASVFGVDLNGPALPLGVNVHLCITASKAGRAQFYVNGTRVANASVTFPTTSVITPLSIGGTAEEAVLTSTGNDRGVGGLIGGVLVYGRALSAVEVGQLASHEVL